MQQFNFSIEIKKTRRKKTIAICIKQGRVQILSPKHCPITIIENFIQKKLHWIEHTLATQSKMYPLQNKLYMERTPVDYLGNTYYLKIVLLEKKEEQLPRVIIQKNTIIIEYIENTQDFDDAPQQVKYILEQWYIRQAEKILTERTEHFSKILEVCPHAILVKSYNAQWGSCSSKGKISYNWKIMIAPLYIVDYLVVHELCHLIEHNHSRAFWKLVQNVLPNYLALRYWLKHNGFRLQL